MNSDSRYAVMGFGHIRKLSKSITTRYSVPWSAVHFGSGLSDNNVLGASCWINAKRLRKFARQPLAFSILTARDMNELR
jgi:hypothetical protein